MATKTITVTEKAYRELARCKESGESFTDTILRIAGQQIITVDDMRASLAARRAAGLPLFGSRLKSKSRRRVA